MDNPETL